MKVKKIFSRNYSGTVYRRGGSTFRLQQLRYTDEHNIKDRNSFTD